MNRLSGAVVEWDDKRGYGWVEVDGKRTFAHMRDFGRTTRRPRKGDEVSFLPGKDAEGRNCAQEIEFTGKSFFKHGITPDIAIVLSCTLVIPIIAGFKISVAPWILPAWFLMASRMSWLQYSFDKERAQAGMARLSEWTLLGADLVGGWPGGFMAHRKLRHKTRKWSYQARYWLIVALWQLVAFELLTGYIRKSLSAE